MPEPTSFNRMLRSTDAMPAMRPINQDLDPDTLALLELLGSLGAGPAADALSRKAWPVSSNLVEDLIRKLRERGAKTIPSDLMTRAEVRQPGPTGALGAMRERQELLKKLLEQ